MKVSDNPNLEKPGDFSWRTSLVSFRLRRVLIVSVTILPMI